MSFLPHFSLSVYRDEGEDAGTARRYFGCGTMRRYGLGAFHPAGTASSRRRRSPTRDDHVLAVLPVRRRRTLCLAVSWSESITRSTSSKLRPVVIG
jgi:hypothetical protein